MKLKRHLCVLFVSVVLTSCASLSERAQKHFEKGEYSAAASLYERAIARDPKNAEAIEGLMRTRQQLIQERLIQVRLLRLANNSQEALDSLNGILKDEANWKLSPTGVAFSTQTEESQESFKWFHSRIESYLTAEQNLKAKLYSETYSHIFASGDLSPKYNRIANSINDRGLAQCRTMRKTSSGIYAAEFADRFCMVWGAKDREIQSLRHKGPDTYGQIQLAGKIANLPPEVSVGLTDAILTGLKTSPYYRPQAKPLKVHLMGSFSSSFNEQDFIDTFSYNVQIPYQERISVPYQEDETEPYEEYETTTRTETIWDPLTGRTTTKEVTSNQQVMKYREVSKTKYRDEWITKYRSEERSVQYPATRFNLHYQINAKMVFSIDSAQYELPLNDELNLTDTYHKVNNPEIGLIAKPRSYPNAMEWLNGRFAITQKLVGEKIEANWSAKYCQFSPEQIAQTQTDAVMKCLRGTRQEHEFVNNWFQARFGLPYAKVNEVVGIVR